MLTPRFEIEQSENGVTFIIHAPLANIKDTEVYVEGIDFRFHSSPYYLRLNLPGEIEENDSSKGEYDSDKGIFTLKFDKVHKGEHFENLDMITTLLAPSKKKNHSLPTIEVLSNPCAKFEDNKDANNEDIKEEYEDGDEWHVEQNAPSENLEPLLFLPKYGFANKMSGVLGTFEKEMVKEIIDLPDPDRTMTKDRKYLREKQESSRFDEQHYMADFVQKDQIEPYISYEPNYISFFESDIEFNDAEKDLLKELPNKEYLLDESEIYYALFNMVDILFAYAYDHRTTFGENTVESGWTINKLSSTLCWFEKFTNLEDVVTSCIRRSLCYPLYRNWNLSIKTLEDTKCILKLGKKFIVKCFCEIHHIFNTSHEPRYILNQLYIKDYLIWLQGLNNEYIKKIYILLENIKPLKQKMGLDIVEIEFAAESVQKDNLVIENDVNDLTKYFSEACLENKQLLNNNNSSSSDSSSTSGSSSSSSDSSSDCCNSSSLDSDDDSN